MNDYSNRQVEFPNRIQLIKVPGTEDIFDFVWVPGQITNPGGVANEAFFKSIDDDIKAKLPKTSKATQAQAEAGTDNNTYMTPLRVKQSKLGNKIHISTGTVNDGDIIPQTTGYEHYIYFVSPHMSSSTAVTFSDTHGAQGVSYRIQCLVDQSTRQVSAKAYIGIQHYGSSWEGNTDSIKANYIEIAWN